MLESGVSGEDRVVGLDDGAGQLGCRVYTELELGLFAVVSGETLEEESAETGTGTTAERVEDEEALKTRAGIGELAHAIECLVDELLAHGVVTTRV